MDEHANHSARAEEGYSYTLLSNGSTVPTHEVELEHVVAIEIMILWGANVLHVSHLSPPRSFYLGNSIDKGSSCDFLLPEEMLPAGRVPLIVSDGTGASVVLPPNVSGRVESADHESCSLERVRVQAAPCSSWPGAMEWALPLGTTVTMEWGEFVVRIAAVKAGKPTKKGLASALDWNAVSFFGLSMASFGSLALALAYFVPPLGLEPDEANSKDRLLLLQQYLNAAAEREREDRSESVVDPTPPGEAASGAAAAGPSGAMGKPNSPSKASMYQVKGPSTNTDLQLARQAALNEARTFGLVQMLTGDPNAPTAPWGGDFPMGHGEVSAHGTLWGDEIGESIGGGGFTLSGPGEGGGGRGTGIGLDSIGDGIGIGRAGGGISRGLPGGVHKPRAPSVIRSTETTVSGRIPPEVIQRIVRQNFGRFRMCYEQGLTRNPNLAGRVSVRFVIGRDGAVSNVTNGGSDLPESGVVSCVLSSFYGLSFPPPDGGIVSVVYPLMFSPG